uniref:40S ribosomal protein S8 n=1 Tax=Balaenoptera musculus TaxID=9771 RepID=A0A8C0DTS4_BALMU
MGISQDNWKPYNQKRKCELGCPTANTKTGPRHRHTVRMLDVGNFSWGSACCTRKTRITDIVYNTSNDELVHTKTLVQNGIMLTNNTWYAPLCPAPGPQEGAKLTPEEEETLNKKQSKKIQKKYEERKKNTQISRLLEQGSPQGKRLACITSRPGQCGQADGFVLEDKELEFYLRNTKAPKSK